MSGVHVFDFDIDFSGAWVFVAQEPMFPKCLSDGEVDTNIRLLKDNLDAVAQKMKVALREQAKKPITFG